MVKNCNDSLNIIFNNFSQNLLVEKPCKIINVNSQYSVDIEYYDNNRPEILYNVPVKHLQTKKAFIFMGLAKGDRGTVRFLDNDVSAYLNSSINPNKEIKSHDINDNLFSLGFYPASEQYIIPSGDIVIGTKAGAIIKFGENDLTITANNLNVQGENIKINGSSVSLGSDTSIDGKNFLHHTHSNGNEGKPTGGVI